MDFLKYRYICLVISLLVIISGITIGLVNGFSFDIDFMGGTKIQADLKTTFENKDIENLVKEITGSAPLVQKLSSGVSSVSITTEVISEEKSNEIVDKLRETYTEMDEPSIRNVQPSFGKELIDSAIIAIIVSILALLVYIGIRFKTLGFTAAITAVIALVHDALMIIAIYGIFGLPINSTFVAVILTIIGYSINDTIVVYDRIRENKRKVTRSDDLKDTINLSLNQTFKRTLYTSITTLIAIGSVYVFAFINNQQVLKEFSFPLILGVLVGTYSSIFIASSLWYMLDSKFGKNKKVKSK